MRLRFTVLACALSALACAVAPNVAGAAPRHNRGLTIRAVPHRIIAGEAVLIYGRLHGPDHAGQKVRLYHRVNPMPWFRPIGTATTNAAGQYEFTRVEGQVLTNRNWFVRGVGRDWFTHSRTVHERVAALISLSASATSGLTRHPIVFSGHVTPNHTGSVVLLQRQRGSSDDWRTIRRGRVGPGSNFNISRAWRVPGDYTVRAVLRRDARNTAAASDPVSVVIEQTEVPDFTIQTSDPVVPSGQPATVSGTLYEPGTTTPEPDTSVSLFATVPQRHRFRELQTATTAADGSYAFANLVSSTNRLYVVRTTFAPHRRTAAMFEGAQDIVTMQPSSTTSTVGGRITFSGSVSPDKAGHAVYLQRLGADGDWHTVEIRRVRWTSTFQFGWTFGTAGTKQFRARTLGGPVNVGGASTPVTIDVTQPPLSSLPTG
ncbi:MAG: hypothetical protein ACRDLV_03940 [Solirubrobacteraceae bacterium]